MKLPQPSPHKKRSDLQGLRGIAILSVILFHIRQDFFSNGFLGVDVFFVLSGFLISSILSRNENPSCQLFLDFYKRRFKRIVPLYSSILLLCMISSLLLFSPIDVTKTRSSFIWSLFFARNIEQISDARDYWKQASDNRRSLLLHTWSLGVEIQYYVIAPFISTVSLSINSRSARIIFQAVLSAVSLFFYLSSDSTIQFNSPLCRYWQFLLGSISAEFSGAKGMKALISATDKEALLEEQPDEVSVKEETMRLSRKNVTILVWILLILLISPIPIEKRTGAIAISVLVAAIIVIGNDDETPLLSHYVLTYLGDISYALYLIHWPVIVFYAYQRERATIDSWDSLISVLFITMVLTLLFHQTVEKWSLRTGYLSSALYVAVMYTALATLLLNSSSISNALLSNRIDDLVKTNNEMDKTTGDWKPDMNFTKEQIKEIISFNTARALLPFPPHEVDYEARNWTNYTDESEHNDYSFIWKGTGNLSVLLLGNSFGWRAAPVINEVFQGHFSVLRVYTHLGCRILTDIDCPKYRAAYPIVLEKMRPDITLVIARDPNYLINTTISLHNITKERINEIKKFSLRVVIDGQNTFCGNQLKLKSGEEIDTAAEIVRRLQKGTYNMEELHWARNKSDSYHSVETSILSSIAKDNSNITFNNIYEQFCLEKEGVCPFYNSTNLHSFYDDKWGHLISEGLLTLRSGYRRIVNRLVQELSVG